MLTAAQGKCPRRVSRKAVWAYFSVILPWPALWDRMALICWLWWFPGIHLSPVKAPTVSAAPGPWHFPAFPQGTVVSHDSQRTLCSPFIGCSRKTGGKGTVQPVGGNVWWWKMMCMVPAHSMRSGTFSDLSKYVIILLYNFASRFIDRRPAANRRYVCC